MNNLGSHLTWVSLSLLFNKMGAYERYLLRLFWGLDTCWIYFVSLKAMWLQASIIRSLDVWGSWWKMVVDIHTGKLFYVGRSTWVGDIEVISAENLLLWLLNLSFFVCKKLSPCGDWNPYNTILRTFSENSLLKTYQQGFWPPLHRHTSFLASRGLSKRTWKNAKHKYTCFILRSGLLL